MLWKRICVERYSMKFENIKNIDISNPSTWQDKIFLTFDLDWCSDEMLSYTLDIIEGM